MRCVATRLLGESAFDEFFFPLVDEGPVGGAGAEVGHVEIAFEAVDGALDVRVFLSEDGAVAGEEPADVARLDAF